MIVPILFCLVSCMVTILALNVFIALKRLSFFDFKPAAFVPIIEILIFFKLYFFRFFLPYHLLDFLCFINNFRDDFIFLDGSMLAFFERAGWGEIESMDLVWAKDSSSYFSLKKDDDDLLCLPWGGKTYIYVLSNSFQNCTLEPFYAQICIANRFSLQNHTVLCLQNRSLSESSLEISRPGFQA